MNSILSKQQYELEIQQGKNNPESFWAEKAKRLEWIQFPKKIKNTNFTLGSLEEGSLGDVHIRWFEDGKLNVSVNCLDRHLASKGNDIAYIWVSDSPTEASRSFTYRELYESVCQYANALKELGVKRGDRVTIYLPLIPEAPISMLACSRIGAIHNVIFGGFSPESISNRILDCQSEWVITADEGLRGGKTIPLKANVDQALESCPNVKKVMVVKRTAKAVPMKAGRDIFSEDCVPKQPKTCAAEPMNAEDPLFILYTSGSTGKPKGVLHTTGGYLVQAAYTHEVVFDYHPGELYWCTADVGWVTGHSYVVYGPLANGAKSLLFEGIPTHPDYSRHWQIIDQFGVNIYYTAPTAIRMLLVQGNDPLASTHRKSLRVLGSVGEPINPEAWHWYHEVVGKGRCPIVDTWWQTETGAILLTPLVGVNEKLKPGSAMQPLPGINPAIVDDQGKEIPWSPGKEISGNLVLMDSWPSQARTVYGDHSRFVKTYFNQFPGKYTTGDGARRDADGHYWITGRVDDVLNVSGHRLGTAEVESALDSHSSVGESAVVGFPHAIKGQGVYAFVTLQKGVEKTDRLKNELLDWVKTKIGPIAKPDAIHWADQLPKTRSGKIMRRILRKIAENRLNELGDVSTLADPSVVPQLTTGRVDVPLARE